MSVRLINCSSKLIRKWWIPHILIVMKLRSDSFLTFKECTNIPQPNIEGSNGITTEMHAFV